jgi:hypothetical protein
MTAAAASVAIPLIWDHRPSAAEVDEMACEFFRLEKKVDEAYKFAVELDECFETVKERCLLAVEEFGEHGPQSKSLFGLRTELVAISVGTRCINRFVPFRNPPRLAVRERAARGSRNHDDSSSGSTSFR